MSPISTLRKRHNFSKFWQSTIEKWPALNLEIADV